MLIKVNGVNLSYPGLGGDIEALKQIDLEIKEGDFLGIMGRTGSGKSSLIEMLAGLNRPSSGQVLLEGQDIYGTGFSEEKLRKKLGIVFQNPDHQLFESTVERELAFGLKYSELSREVIQERLVWALEKLGFDYSKIKNKSPLAFSGGERRKLALAGILAVKPSILIFDEPVSGLDPSSRRDFLRLTKELNQEGFTIIMVSHDLEALAQCSLRLILMDGGRILRDASPEEILGDRKLLKELDLISTPSQEVSRKLLARGKDLGPGIIRKEELLEALLREFKGASL